MKLQSARGMQDSMPEQEQQLVQMRKVLVGVFERFGFLPLDTPVVERFDVLVAKYAGGNEILKEMFRLKDQGGRELALRYDLTVPLARVIGMNPALKMPVKRYQLGPVFRDGPVATGRLRQFTQCDVDIVGAAGAAADAEVLALAYQCFQELGMSVKIRVNSREILDALLRKAGVADKVMSTAILAIDKLDKIGMEKVAAELGRLGIKSSAVQNISAWIKGSFSTIKKVVGSAADQMGEILALTKKMGVKVSYDASLARGLAYYTGMVVEVTTAKLKVSVAGGGRWDEMIGGFLGRGKYPAVGISFGVERIALALAEKSVAVTKVFVIPIKTQPEAMQLAMELRAAGIATDIDLMERGVSKNLAHASALGIPYAVVYGPKEVGQGKVTLRDLRNGKESLVGLATLAKRLK